jgi:hypothetical protein
MKLKSEIREEQFSLRTGPQQVTELCSGADGTRASVACLLTPWLYNPLRNLASFTTDAPSSLLFAFSPSLFFSFSSHKSISTSSNRLNLRLHCLMSTPVSYILITCSKHCNLVLSIAATRSGASCALLCFGSTVSRPPRRNHYYHQNV